MTADCWHPPSMHRPGPVVPRVYGSGPTIICACGAWRLNLGDPGGWQPADTLVASMVRDDDW